jgi:NAD(P)H dehydrogenase (quinone)
MTKIAIVFHSGYGHTRRQAEFVQNGVTKTGAEANFLAIDEHGDLPAEAWDILLAADGIIFGAPTYMGSASWQFKKFADASSKPWMAQLWKDKFAAGFTNSGSINGDKFSTIAYFITLAMQHSMAWIGTGIMPSNNKAATRNSSNYLGAFSGALAQSPTDGSAADMFEGDLLTAEAFGERVATFIAAHK